MKIILYSVLLFCVVACQASNDESSQSSSNRLCDCVKAGDKVNHLSASFFDKRPTQSDKDSMDVAIKNRDSICAPFQEMPAKELRKKSVECRSLYYKTE